MPDPRPPAAARPADHLRQGLLDLRRVPVRPAHLVGGDRAHHLGGEQCGRRRPAGAGGARGRDDHNVLRLDQGGGEQGGERHDRRSGVAPRRRDLARGADPGPRARQFGQPVGPAPGVAGPVVGGPRARVGEAEARAEVDDRDVAGQRRGQSRRLLVRQGQEDQVRRGQQPGVGLVEGAPGQPGQMRMNVGHRRARARARGHRADFQVGVARDQAQELTAGVPAGTRDRDPDSHAILPEGLAAGLSRCSRPSKSMHDYDYLCKEDSDYSAKEVSGCDDPERATPATGRGGPTPARRAGREQR